MPPSKRARLKVITNSIFEIANALIVDDAEEAELEELAAQEVLKSLSQPIKSDNIIKRLHGKSAQHYFNELNLGLGDDLFRDFFKMSRSTMEFLAQSVCGSISDQFKRQYNSGRPIIPLTKQLMLTIWLLVNQESFRLVSRRFNICQSTSHACMLRVVNGLVDMASQCVSWPVVGGEGSQQGMQQFQELTGLPELVGVIHSHHIKIKPLEVLPSIYKNKQGVPSISLQLVSDSTNQLIDCYAGQAGSIPHSEVFRLSDLHNRMQTDPQTLFGMNGGYLLGAGCYPLSDHLLTPFNKQAMYEVEGGASAIFNSCCAKALSTGDRTYRLLMGRFRRLRHLDMARIDLIPGVVVAACVLHNLCLQYGDEPDESWLNMEDEELSYKEICYEGSYSWENAENEEETRQRKENGARKREEIISVVLQKSLW